MESIPDPRSMFYPSTSPPPWPPDAMVSWVARVGDMGQLKTERLEPVFPLVCAFLTKNNLLHLEELNMEFYLEQGIVACSR